MFVRKPEGKRPPSRPGCRWDINIKWEEIGWKGVDWIHFALSVFFPGMQQNHIS
jgi:hypothetical protein